MSGHLPFTLLFVLGLLFVSYYDLKFMIIPNWLNASIFLVGLFFAWHQSQHQFFWGLGGAAAVFLTGWALKWVYQKKRGITGLGGGDVKFAAAVVPWVGITSIPTMVLIAAFLALMTVALRSLVGEQVTRHTSLPFGPFLVVGVCWVWFFGPLIISIPSS